jgi:hypothetical protein
MIIESLEKQRKKLRLSATNLSEYNAKIADYLQKNTNLEIPHPKSQISIEYKHINFKYKIHLLNDMSFL